ncbi:RNA methyltransferase [Propionivibrio limicola]|uniref:RNA methyltransferase n=1 Tax=Propionivibrio limicola TaxID=167645 RepID=UPI001292A9C5|nr:RNA methyltransferase [Propionivibrio limicola]
MRIEQLLEQLRQLGAKPGHVQRILRAWVQARDLSSGGRRQRAEDCLPLAVREALPRLAAELAGLARVRSEHPGGDGSARLLVELADGQTVESVLLPRDGVCVSTQVGCAVGCAFCMTGQGGLLRQLGSAEIVAQVVLARQRRPVKKVVFMGMGEPSHNLDNVLAAIDLLGTEGGIGHKNLVFSTVGDRRVFERLPRERVKPALAVSLHTTDPDLRARLLPRASRLDPSELVELAEIYARAIGYPIQYQWTLLDGVNDSEAEMERLIRLLSGKYAMMNFIPFNAVEGAAFARPAWEKAEALVAHLRREGIIACLRDSAGQDVDGGCGQLRARAVRSERRDPRFRLEGESAE